MQTAEAANLQIMYFIRRGGAKHQATISSSIKLLFLKSEIVCDGYRFLKRKAKNNKSYKWRTFDNSEHF